VTALQDWLSLRPFDPRDHVKALICALRGVSPDHTAEAAVNAEPVLIQPGLERC
jgi:hypothetical protein